MIREQTNLCAAHFFFIVKENNSQLKEKNKNARSLRSFICCWQKIEPIENKKKFVFFFYGNTNLFKSCLFFFDLSSSTIFRERFLNDYHTFCGSLIFSIGLEKKIQQFIFLFPDRIRLCAQIGLIQMKNIKLRLTNLVLV